MNNPQFWGALRGVLIALGGMLASLGLITAADWAQIVDHGLGIASGLAGLAMIVWPMIQGWRARSRAGLVTDTAAVLKPNEKIVLNSAAEARAIPDPKVVGPAG